MRDAVIFDVDGTLVNVSALHHLINSLYVGFLLHVVSVKVTQSLPSGNGLKVLVVR
jgi:beta-phosphoglucomutase-like phosphatase (HAD superfamily)